MSNERVLVFQPKDISKYARDQDGIERFLDGIVQSRRSQIQGQFQLFPYLAPDIKDRGWYNAGLIYRREMKDTEDPMSFVPGQDAKKSLRALALELGGDITKDEFFIGRMEIRGPTMEQHKKILKAAYSPEHRDYAASGLRKPDEVLRFFLSLDPNVCEKIIIPILETLGYKERIKVEKVG
jgi:hypothetical protein